MDTEISNSLQEAVKNSYTNVDDTGSVHHIFDFEKSESVDRIVIVFDKDDDVPHQLRIYEDTESDEPDKKMAFKDRRVTFDPISVIGRGETNALYGLTPTSNSEERSYTPRTNNHDNVGTTIIDSYDEVPSVAKEVWKSLGYTVIQNGSEWQI